MTMHLSRRLRLKDPRAFAVVVDNVFTHGECQELIALSESRAYEPALIDVGGGEYTVDTELRDSDRVMIDDADFAAKLFGRLRAHLPQVWQRHTLAGVNERLRFLRYDKGQSFPAHSDGSYERADGSEVSFITVQLYLNGDFEGGETSFLADSHSFWEDEDDAEPVTICTVKPKSGLVLLFEHDLLHAGCCVRSGRKYCLRSDIMYRAPGN